MTSVTAPSLVPAMQRPNRRCFAVAFAPGTAQEDQCKNTDDKHKSDDCWDRHHAPGRLLRMAPLYMRKPDTPNRGVSA